MKKKKVPKIGKDKNRSRKIKKSLKITNKQKNELATKKTEICANAHKNLCSSTSSKI